ncbi:MAG: LacI family DNA-binding transcriptional regulator [Verrucomicrobia bacterium]|nr:LacI family DNA-binding transcriptional regulator [Verrucomicrobiota bacterium]
MNSSRPAGIRAVAKHAGVSVATVSRVINNSDPVSGGIRFRVLNAIGQLNYHPQPLFSQVFRDCRSGRPSSPLRTRTIGFLTHDWLLRKAQHDDGYYSRVLAGVQQTCLQNRYYVTLVGATPDLVEIPSIILENRIDGLLVEGRLPVKLLQLLVRRLPIVFIDNTYPDLPASSVMPDVRRATREVLTHLWQLDHRNLVTFQAVDCHRYDCAHVFRDFFEEKNHPVIHPHLCEEQSIDTASHATVMAAYARQVAAARPRPTAVVTWDVYGIALLTEFRKLGLRVPEDISVTGMDDTTQARLATPPLTSYRFPMDEMGRSATELLFQHIETDQRPVRHLLINGMLAARATSAACNDAPFSANKSTTGAT